MGLLVQKFGGSSLATPQRVVRAAKRAVVEFDAGNQVVMVVSAMGDRTDELVNLAKKIHPDPDPREMDTLLAVGEQTSIALMAIAIHKLGRGAISLTGAQAGIRTVITSRAFIERLPLPAQPARTLYVEDLARLVGPWNALTAALKANLLPQALLRRLYGARGRSMDDTATVIFSSGTTGEPKGVMLTHSNIMSNIEGLGQVFGFTGNDRICGVLPFFHSFGFTTTLWFPLVKRIRVVYHTSPLEGPAIGALVRESGATVLLSTPSFLRIYLRSVLPEDFGSLEHVVVGAEKLRDDLRESFRQKFGIAPVEGYGCT